MDVFLCIIQTFPPFFIQYVGIRGGNTHLQAAKTLDKLLAEEAAHLHIIDVVERRIEMADIVDHLYQIVHIDDVLLVDLHKLLVETSQRLALYIALQADRSRNTCHHNLSAATFVIILEYTDVSLVNQLEVCTVGIEQELVILRIRDTQAVFIQRYSPG